MLAAFLVFLLSLAQEPPEPARTAQVVVEALDVLDEPDALGFVTGQLRRGDQVLVREEAQAGWLAIEPPKGSFGWIDQDAIEEDGGRSARVVAERASIRSGRAGARMPGRPRTTVEQGETVTLLDRPALRLTQGSAVRVWRAISPLSREVRYIRAEGIRWVGEQVEGENADQNEPEPEPAPEPDSERRAQVVRASERTEPLDRTLAMAGPIAGEAAFPPALAAAIAQIEATHRRILRQPVERWDLEPVRQRYQAMLERETDAAVRSALGARLARVERQQGVAQTARSLNALLMKSKQLDGQIARIEQAVPPPPAAVPLPYDADGLLQTSSRTAEGQTLFALIGKQGQTLAFLKMPPGLNGHTMLARRVGVRGTIRYSELLRSNLIIVRELDALSDPP